jgi:O-antigen ligase
MTPKKKKRSQTRRKHGTWFVVGQVLIIVGAALIIASVIIDAVNGFQDNSAWQSYTFGQLNLYVGLAIAVVAAIAILWLAIDKRAYYGLNLYVYAVIIIILACLAGNVGALVCFIGAIVIIFYRIARSP